MKKQWLGHVASAATVFTLMLTIYLSILQPLTVAKARDKVKEEMKPVVDSKASKEIILQVEKRLDAAIQGLANRLDRIETKIDSIKRK